VGIALGLSTLQARTPLWAAPPRTHFAIGADRAAGIKDKWKSEN